MRRGTLGCMAAGCFLLPVITLILVLKFVSDHRIPTHARRPAGTALSIPPPGHARILARKVVEGPAKSEWQWTVVGDRNWTTAAIRNGALELGGAYPFNSRARLGGTHIWTVDITAFSTPEAGGGTAGLLRVDSSIHGSNGTTVTETGTVGESGGRKPILSALQTTDALVSIPAEVPLALVGGRRLSLKINP